MYMHMHMEGKSRQIDCFNVTQLYLSSTKQSGWWPFGFHTKMSSVWLYYRHVSHYQQNSQADELSVSHANVVTLTVLSPLITLSTKQSGWRTFGFSRKCRHSDCIIATHHIVNKAVRLTNFRFHTQMSSLWLYYRHSSQCQQSSQADELSVSHANVVTLIVWSPLITLSTKLSGWRTFGFTRKCRHSDCMIATHHNVNKAVRLTNFRFQTQMSSLWLYYRHSSHCQQSSQADEFSVSHANVVTLTVVPCTKFCSDHCIRI